MIKSKELDELFKRAKRTSCKAEKKKIGKDEVASIMRPIEGALRAYHEQQMHMKKAKKKDDC